MKAIKQLVLASILVLFTTAVFAETKMRITLQLPLKAHLGQNLLVFKKEVEKKIRHKSWNLWFCATI